MKKVWILSLLVVLCLVSVAVANPLPPQQQQTNYIDLYGTITSAGQADVGAHVYLLPGNVDTVTAANLDEMVAKAYRTADADDKGEWRIGQVYTQDYKVVFVSAHDRRIAQEPLTLLAGGEYQHRIDHNF